MLPIEDNHILFLKSGFSLDELIVEFKKFSELHNKPLSQIYLHKNNEFIFLQTKK